MAGLVATMLAVVVFTVIGPLGTWETVAPFRRLQFWLVCAFFGWPILYFKSAVILFIMRCRSALAVIVALTAGTLVACGAITAILYTAGVMLRLNFTVSLPSIYLLSVTVGGPYTFLIHYVVCQRINRPGGPSDSRRDGDTADATSEDTIGAVAGSETRDDEDRGVDDDANMAPAPPTLPTGIFLNRLSRKIDGDLIYVRSDGHYLTVHTTAGSCSILMRFTDAVTDLGTRGMRVHRSYWVARDQIIETAHRDNRLVLRLTGDHEVPVSRTYLSAVRRALAHA